MHVIEKKGSKVSPEVHSSDYLSPHTMYQFGYRSTKAKLNVYTYIVHVPEWRLLEVGFSGEIVLHVWVLGVLHTWLPAQATGCSPSLWCGCRGLTTLLGAYR